MATLGNTLEGTDSENWGTRYQMASQFFMPVGGGIITDMTGWVLPTTIATTVSLAFAVWADNAGVPGALLGTKSVDVPYTDGTTDQQATVSGLSIPVLCGYVWLGYDMVHALVDVGTNVIKVHNQTLSYLNVGTGNPPADPFGSGSNGYVGGVPVFATYIEGLTLPKLNTHFIYIGKNK